MKSSKRHLSEIDHLKMRIADLNELYRTAIMELVKREDTQSEIPQTDDRFKTIFRQLNIACIIIDSDFKILEVNAAASMLLGYPEETLTGSTLFNYLRNDFKEHWQVSQKALWSKTVPFMEFEGCLMRQDGTEVWCHANTILFADRNETLACTMLEDISTRKANEFKRNELLNTVSHELKTPLTILNAFAQLLDRKLAASDIDSAQGILQKIITQSDKLSQLIHDLLDATRIESGKISLKLNFFNLSNMLEEVINNFRVSSLKTFHTEIEDKMMYHGDASRMEQVMVNLIGNAIKYAPDANSIIISASSTQDELVCKVQDFGSGISEADQKHLFERFFRTSERRSGMIPGLGLGLYICAEIIQLHRGKLWVNSAPGKGSTFGFTLPFQINNG